MTRDWTFPATVEGAYDGDTFYTTVDLGFSLQHHFSCRLHGIDTPELRGGSELTKAAAKLARDEALRFIRAGTEVLFRSELWAGKYGRPVGDFIVDGRSLRDWLLEHRHGVAYDGGTRAGFLARHVHNAEHHRGMGRLVPYGIEGGTTT